MGTAARIPPDAANGAALHARARGAGREAAAARRLRAARRRAEAAAGGSQEARLLERGFARRWGGAGLNLLGQAVVGRNPPSARWASTFRPVTPSGGTRPTRSSSDARTRSSETRSRPRTGDKTFVAISSQAAAPIPAARSRPEPSGRAIAISSTGRKSGFRVPVNPSGGWCSPAPAARAATASPRSSWRSRSRASPTNRSR